MDCGLQLSLLVTTVSEVLNTYIKHCLLVNSDFLLPFCATLALLCIQLSAGLEIEMFVRMLTVHCDKNNSYEITINGFQVRKINEINKIRNVPFLLCFLFRLFF